MSELCISKLLRVDSYIGETDGAIARTRLWHPLFRCQGAQSTYVGGSGLERDVAPKGEEPGVPGAPFRP
jgi:hypothetical protein